VALLFEDHDGDESLRVLHMAAKAQTRIPVTGNITSNHIGPLCNNAVELIILIPTFCMQHSDR